MELRKHPRFDVRARVDFEWTEEGVLRTGQGLTRDISSKGMFIYSDAKPLSTADLRVKVSFASLGRGLTNLHLRTNSLVIREEPPSSTEAVYGFAILNKHYELHNGIASIED